MSTIDAVLKANEEYARNFKLGNLPAPPARHLAILACMDARLTVEQFGGLGTGDAHIIRNAGGLATDDAMRSLSASQRLLGTEEIVVVMHDGCGLCGASEDSFRQGLAADGVLPDWRLGAFESVEHALRTSLRRLRCSRELPRRERIRGFVFNPEDGRLREVAAPAAAQPASPGE